MLKRLVSWIFGSGSTDVSIPSSEVVLAKPWWEVGSTETVNDSHIPGWKLSPDERAALKRIMGESYFVPQNGITQEQLQILRAFVDLEQRAAKRATSPSKSKAAPITDDATIDTGPDGGVFKGVTTPVVTVGEEKIFLSDLTGMERTALYHLMGASYISTTNAISSAQLTVLRAFAGFDWGSGELAHWKSEFAGADVWNLRGGETTSFVGVSVGEPLTGGSSASTVGNAVIGWNDRDPFYLAEEYEDEDYYFCDDDDDDDDDEVEETPVQSSAVEGGSNWVGLNDEQQRVFDYIEDTSQNLFVTGRAGSGKSFLLRYVSEFSSKTSIVVAPTGVAALNAQGSTIHSMFRLPWGFLNDESVLEAFRNLSYERATVLRKIEMLIVDEISMVSADMLLALDKLLRMVREIEEPFGGVQMLLFGDPFQLEPVVTEKSLKQFYADVWGSPYFFSSPAWPVGHFVKVELKNSMRQSEDDFLDALDALRRGTAKFSQLDLINRRFLDEKRIPKSGTVRLSGSNRAVNEYNDHRLGEIPGPSRKFIGHYEGDFDRDLKRVLAPDILEIKVGAQIMMLANHDAKLWVNGSTAEVAEILDDEIWIEIEHSKHEVRPHNWRQLRHTYDRSTGTIKQEVTGAFVQFPMTLGWARTIHKSQGQTYVSCSVDLQDGIFAHGQSYVAISRCKSLEGLYLNRPLELTDIRVSSQVQNFMSDLTSPWDLPPF